MATQRVIPIEVDSYPAKVITINPGYVPTPQACKIAGSAQQEVTFTNNSGATIDIRFDGIPVIGNVFSDITGLTDGNSSDPQLPQVANGTANYRVYVGGVKQAGGPYAIQVGNGPMYIQVTNVATGPMTNPDPVAIPYGGTLEMLPGDAHTYGVSWKNNLDPFTPPITKVDSTPHTEQLSAIADYKYTVTKTEIKFGTGNGGGTVKIKGT
jgi:hypothetical protein